MLAPASRWIWIGLALAVAVAAAPACAQVQLPAAPLPTSPLNQQTLTRALDPVLRPATDLADRNLERVRRLQLARLVREHRDVLDTDATGAPVVRSQVLAVEPDTANLQRARDAGFEIGAEQRLDELGLRLVTLRAPAGLSTRRALERLRRADPQGQYEYNHLYSGSGGHGASTDSFGGSAPAASPVAPGWRVGLLDSGVDAAHPALRGVRLTPWGCDGRSMPDAHGTAIASLLAGDGERAQPGVQLFAADVYCGQPTGGNAAGLAAALAWLARQGVAVVNVSLVGPDNALLRRVIEAAQARGMVIVAAVGNDGPAAPPLFPAAYPGVIGVTAVDGRERVLPEAGRGPQVDLAALGVETRAAAPGGKTQAVRGTSFAAPRVAALAAQLAAQPQPGLAEKLLTDLSLRARDLGRRGTDTTYGRGLVPGAVAEQSATLAPARE